MAYEIITWDTHCKSKCKKCANYKESVECIEVDCLYLQHRPSRFKNDGYKEETKQKVEVVR